MSFATETTSSVSPISAAVLTAPGVQHRRSEERSPVEMGGRRTNVSGAEAKQAVDKLNAAVQSIQTELSFTVDTDTDKMVVKVVNSQTHEVIRQIPAEDALRIASRLQKLLGLLFDENA